MTRAEAEVIIAAYGSDAEALKATHPDTGGTAAAFARVQRAREVLGRRAKPRPVGTPTEEVGHDAR